MIEGGSSYCLHSFIVYLLLCVGFPAIRTPEGRMFGGGKRL
jgi:hypothetical protein